MAALTLSGWVSARETVAVDTRAMRATSASLARLARSVTTSLAALILTRCSIAFGPNAVNSG